ncbi:MAG: copper resistance protein CopC, partial [Gemmatimonadota bacterium]|nr:copper resistance protein CopC [Gemmatimonadota bacterium]
MGAEARATRRLSLQTMRAALFVALLPFLAGAGPLHTALESSEPAEDSVLREPPREIRLEYTTDVQVNLSRIRLAGPHEEVEIGPLRYLAANRHDVLVAPLPQGLLPGAYRVAWTTAGPDGHPINGEFEYSLLGPTPGEEALGTQDSTRSQTQDSATAPPVDTTAPGDVEGGAAAGQPPVMGDPNSSRGATGGRWLFYLGIVATIGALSFRYAVLPQVTRGGELPEVAKGANHRLWRIAGVGALALLVSSPVRLFYQVRSFYAGEEEIPVSAYFQMAGAGPWGSGWLLGVAAALLVGAGVLLARPRGERNPGWAVMALGAVFLPLSPVLSGHAWGRTPQALAATADFVHVTAAAAWVGGLLCLLFAGLPALRAHGVKEGSGQPGLPGMVRAFSRIAMVSVALLLLSGALN